MSDAIDQADFVKRNYRWNFATNLLESSLCLFGRGFVSFGTFLPVFLSLFTESKVLIGLAGTLFPAGMLLPQLFTAPYIESLPRKKGAVVRLAIIEKLLYLALAFVALIAFTLRPEVVVGLVLLICLLLGLGGGIVQTGWSELMASIFPERSRGRYFGTSLFIGGLLSAVGAYVGGLILSGGEPPGNYARTFLAGSCIILVSWTFLLWIREPPAARPPQPRMSQRALLRDLPGIFQRDRFFAMFVLAQTVVSVGAMAALFVAVYGRERLALDGYQMGVLTTSLLLGSTIASLAFGWLGDRYGHRALLLAGIALQALGAALCAMSADFALLGAAVFVFGAGRGGMGVNQQQVVYECAPLDRRPTYIGLSATVFGVAGLVTPLLGGLVAQAWGYSVMFAVSAVISAAALLLHVAAGEKRNISHITGGLRR
jgi:MFS family permease